jgi:hypothetical protein
MDPNSSRSRRRDSRICLRTALKETTLVAASHNKQLQRTVTRRRGRGVGASLHYAHAPPLHTAVRGR